MARLGLEGWIGARCGLEMAGVRMGQKSKNKTVIFKLISGWVVVAISFDFGALNYVRHFMFLFSYLLIHQQ